MLTWPHPNLAKSSCWVTIIWVIIGWATLGRAGLLVWVTVSLQAESLECSNLAKLFQPSSVGHKQTWATIPTFPWSLSYFSMISTGISSSRTYKYPGIYAPRGSFLNLSLVLLSLFVLIFGHHGYLSIGGDSRGQPSTNPLMRINPCRSNYIMEKGFVSNL